MQRALLMCAVALSGCGRTALFETATSPGKVTRTRARLPSPREPAVFNDGTYAYVIGGETTFGPGRALSDIIRYDPRTDTVERLEAKLPAGLGQTVAVWTGTHAFIFGGRKDRHALTDEIIRFTPSTGAVRKMNARLPTPRYNQAAVWTGSRVLLLGGFDFTYQTEVVAYDPDSDVVSILAARLPQGREAPAMHWDGASVWLVGGYTGAVTLDTVVRYDASADTVVTEQVRWTHDFWAAASFFDGTRLWVLGGGNVQQSYFSDIDAFDPSTLEMKPSAQTLPAPRAGRGSTWLSGAGYLFGGATGSGLDPQLSDEIIRFVP